MLSPNVEHIKYVHEGLSQCYTMTFDEVATEYLGYSITRDRTNRILKLDQFGTVSKLLSRFPPQSCRKAPRSPFHRKRSNLTGNEESSLSEADKSTIQHITGSLLYSAICTRGDLLYAVHLLTRRMMSISTRHRLTESQKSTSLSYAYSAL
jgi:hypothetical protein